MKKKMLNGLLILIIVSIYGTILDLQFDLFSDKAEVIKISIPENVNTSQNMNEVKTDFNFKRNYFVPVQKSRKKTTPKETAQTADNVANILSVSADTLAVIRSGKEAKYLLKKGDKVWIN